MDAQEAHDRLVARNRARAAMYRRLFMTAIPVDPRPWWAFWRPKSKPGELTQLGEQVLKDLADFCYVSRTTMKISQADQHADPLAMAMAEGRREVALRIFALLRLDAPQVHHIDTVRSADE